MLAVKIDYSRLGGPGQELLSGVAMGHTIALETFATQFILDIEAACGVRADRIYVVNITEGDVHFSWRWASTMVRFRMLDDGRKPSVIDAVRNLTQQTQVPSSRLLRDGNVTSALDEHWGIVALDWDASLRLAFSIDVVAADLVKKDEIHTSVDLGALRYCDQERNISAYCEWEWFFEHDIASALDISPENVDLLSVRPAALDSVLAHFRLLPDSNCTNNLTFMGRLLAQVRNISSDLFKGNVTVRVDPAWGISGVGTTPRKSSSVYLPHAVRGHSSLPFHGFASFDNGTGAAYERCKATHRCPRGYIHYDMGNGSVIYSTQVFAGGRHEPALLFANFEHFALGSRGWHIRDTFNRFINVTAFDYTRLIPTPNVAGIERWGWCHERQPCQPRWYSGLVVNEKRRSLDVSKQSELVANIEADLQWLELHASSIALDADGSRSRADALQLSLHRAADIRAKLHTEQSKLLSLKNAPCNQTTDCFLLFNTSSLELSGAVNVTGEIGNLSDGVEAAIFAFDEIELGPEVNVTFAGQRPLVLASRSSILLNTTLLPRPGTVGGFLGGFSVARTELLSDDPAHVLVGQVNENMSISSYNINGPGSPNVRVRLFTLSSQADHIPQQVRLTITCDDGERVDGVFRIGYLGSWSRWLMPTTSAADIRLALDQDLNFHRDLKRSMGFVNVTRLAASDWLLTMVTARNFIKIDVDKTRLVGRGVIAETTLIRNPNLLGGTFRLVWESVENSTKTRWLPYDVGADEFAIALLEDIDELKATAVTSPVLHNTQDGAPGLVWSLTLASDVDNPTPRTPALTPSFTQTRRLRIETNLTGVNASLTLSSGLRKSHRGHLSRLNDSIFSLAYGGAGAGYGGLGGGVVTALCEGAGKVARRDSIGKITLTNNGTTGGNAHRYDFITGGSGGAMGYVHPFVVSTLAEASSLPARGGAGGASIVLAAANDIRLGSMGEIIVDGGTGSAGHLLGGGGGSGGSILLQADGVLQLDEGYELSARGGNGGDGATASGGGGGGGRVLAYASTQSINSMRLDAHVDGGTCASDSSRDGERGVVRYHFQSGGIRYMVDTDHGGAFGTGGTLRIQAMDASEEATSIYSSPPFQGPEYKLSSENEQPERLSFFLRIDAISSSSTRQASGSWGAALLLYDIPTEGSLQDKNATVAIGIALSDAVRHASGFSGDLQQHLGASKYIRNTLISTARERRWYKIDVLFDWSRRVYDVMVDDILRTDDSILRADGVSRLGLYAWGGRGEASFDEIYLGPDHTMGFRCPRTTRSGVETEITRPLRRGWADQDSRSSYAALSKHHNHISRREVYAHNNGGLKPFDGEGHLSYRSEVDADLKELPAQINAGGLLRLRDGSAASELVRMRAVTADSRTNAYEVRGLPGDIEDDSKGHLASEFYYDESIRRLFGHNQKSRKQDAATYFWYGEHDNPDENAPLWLKGGIGACATDDMVHWRSYGIVLHYANLTDMVHARDAWLPGCDGYSTRFGSERGYGCIGAQGLHAIRPRVLLADLGNTEHVNSTVELPFINDHYSAQESGHGFVMWMGLDDKNYSLALAAVASSAHASGPFSFRRSMYPDGNATRDQAVWSTSNRDLSLLGRSYYADIEYVLPSAQMQPVWQHVLSASGEIDFGLSYHRGIYMRDYDDYHDIYLQRWRLEDKPWLVLCVNRYNHMDNFSVPRGESFGEDGAACPDPDYYKLILGQGYSSEQGLALGINSRFKDPNLANNSHWLASSVPDVKAQPWTNNYLDGACGRGSVDGGWDLNDPDLPDRTITDRSNCSNIRDNPVHETNVDDLVGTLKIVETRRVKFLAVSSLTPDLLDTSAALDFLEGGLEDRIGTSPIELDALLSENFDWNFRGTSMSTFKSPVIAEETFPDLKPVPASVARYHQYNSRYNDRAYHSLGCVFDGDCPVNFLDQTAPAVNGRYGH